MIQVYKNKSTALNGGLNGWFGRLIKRLCEAAIGLVKETPIVGMVFHNELNKLTALVDTPGNFNFRKVPDYEPTPAEALIIETWATNKLNPFYKIMVEQLSSAFASNNNLELINNVVLKMCVVKQYFATNETTGLSPDAVLARMELINKIFEPVEGLIMKSVAEYPTVLQLTPYPFTFTAATAVPFSGLLPKVSGVVFQCNKYVATNTPNVKPGTTTPGATKPVTTTPGTIKPGTTLPTKPTTPGTVKPVVTLPSPTAPITTPIPAVPTTPGTTINPVTTKPAVKKKNYIGWILGAIAAGFAVNELLTEKKN